MVHFSSSPIRMWRRAALLLLSAPLAACSRAPAPITRAKPAAIDAKAPALYVVRFTTTRGDIDVMVHRAWAPLGADRLYGLVRHGYYDGARFFRAVPNFVVQFGIAADTGVTAVMRERTIQDDSVRAENVRGTVTFATSGPNTRTTQLFINLGDNRRLDRMGFSPVGRVIAGMSAVDSLYLGYGEGAPRGRGPLQDRITREGETYLQREFPLLDKILSARIVPLPQR
jgi:peptidyl-prolyl cis-trans isomerase A (cyclophilin A)